jgi:hypothetical protein
MKSDPSFIPGLDISKVVRGKVTSTPPPLVLYKPADASPIMIHESLCSASASSTPIPPAEQSVCALLGLNSWSVEYAQPREETPGEQDVEMIEVSSETASEVPTVVLSDTGYAETEPDTLVLPDDFPETLRD